MVTKFKLFESYYEIESICNRYGIQNWELDPETGLVDVWGEVDFYGRFLKKLPLKFGVVTGNFNCSSNQLFSLEGSPQRVDGNFYCYDNQLASLKGAPSQLVKILIVIETD